MGEPHQSRVYSDLARFYDHTFGRIFVDHEHFYRRDYRSFVLPPHVTREVILRTIEKSNLEEVGDWGVIKEKIRSALRKHFDQETGKRPMILPVILEV